MWSWLIYRMNSTDTKEFVEAISENASLIKRPNSGHAYLHDIKYIVHFSESQQKQVLYKAVPDSQYRDAFWHNLEQEEDIIKLVHGYRKNSLFETTHLASIHKDMQKLLTQFSADYENIWSRHDERVFLKHCSKEAWELFQEIRQSIPKTPHYQSIEQECFERTKVWRWTKRHTSETSFPFLRPGIDINKAIGFDLLGSGDKRLYAVVQVHY